MARADLKKRLEVVAAALGAPVIMGMWASEGGVPTYHHLAAKGMSLETWFKTGELPDRVQFVVVMHVEEAERLKRPEGREHFEIPDEELEACWQPFPDLHPNTVRQLQKMLKLPFYNFHGGQLNGMNGPLPPNEQRRELYPHG